MSDIELCIDRMILVKLVLKILKLDVYVFEQSLLHSLIVHEKKEYLNASVFQKLVVMFFVF